MAKFRLQKLTTSLLVAVHALALITLSSCVESVPPGVAPRYLGQEDSSVWTDCSGPRRVLGFNGPGGLFLRVFGPPAGNENPLVLGVSIFGPGGPAIEPLELSVGVVDLESGAESRAELVFLEQRDAPLQRSAQLSMTVQSMPGAGLRIQLPTIRQGETVWRLGPVELHWVGREWRVIPLNC